MAAKSVGRRSALSFLPSGKRAAILKRLCYLLIFFVVLFKFKNFIGNYLGIIKYSRYKWVHRER